MAYKILYIEDQEPSTYIAELKHQGFDVDHVYPEKFEDLITQISGYSLLLLDFRLTSNKAMFDAPTIAQSLRTKNSKTHIDIPIVLISNEQKISEYYKDLTSQDLFDLSISKERFIANISKYKDVMISIINAYESVKSRVFSINKILAVPSGDVILDYRICEKLEGDIFSTDIFAFASFVLQNIIKSIGVLIGEDVLSARLGVAKSSPDWSKMLALLDSFKYSGIYSDAYNRWWSDGFISWWKTSIDENNTPRRLNAEQRVSILRKKTGLDLVPQAKTEFARSSSYWTICLETKLPLDPIDGLELHRRNLYPWQEAEYISTQAGVKPNLFDANGRPLFRKYIKPVDKKKLSALEKNS